MTVCVSFSLQTVFSHNKTNRQKEVSPEVNEKMSLLTLFFTSLNVLILSFKLIFANYGSVSSQTIKPFIHWMEVAGGRVLTLSSVRLQSRLLQIWLLVYGVGQNTKLRGFITEVHKPKGEVLVGWKLVLSWTEVRWKKPFPVCVGCNILIFLLRPKVGRIFFCLEFKEAQFSLLISIHEKIDWFLSKLLMKILSHSLLLITLCTKATSRYEGNCLNEYVWCINSKLNSSSPSKLCVFVHELFYQSPNPQEGRICLFHGFTSDSVERRGAQVESSSINMQAASGVN